MPVFVGTAAAGEVIWWRFGAALVVAAGLQIGVNYANDYFDGVRGVDTHERLGPPRLTQSGAAVARAPCWWRRSSRSAPRPWPAWPSRSRPSPLLILFVGALALVAALLYSGGPRPYAGLGLGELMVFVFFGLMATCGTAFVMVETVPAAAWWGGRRWGSSRSRSSWRTTCATSRPTRRAGKRTLAVRLGDRRDAALYRACVVAAFATVALGRDRLHRGRADRAHAVGPVRASPRGSLAIRPMEVGRYRERPRPDPCADRHGGDARGARAAVRARALVLRAYAL